METKIAAALAFALLVCGCLQQGTIFLKCTSQTGLTQTLDYGMYGECVFTNPSNASTYSCANINLRLKSGAIVKQQQICLALLPYANVTRHFFMGEDFNTQYTWDFSQS